MTSLRSENIARLGAETLDCLVVGGGINGAASAAALLDRGAKTALVDKSDFASCTSQESSNLAWGGIKYLESYEFGLVWRLCTSRNRLMRAYPGQVREVRFVASIAKGFRKPRCVVFLGTLLYWFMGRCRTAPPHLLGRAAIKRRAPAIDVRQLAGGVEYSDGCYVDNDARFVFNFIRTALDHGCCAVNYMELVSAEWRGGLWHCNLQDRISGLTVAAQARSIVNAAGPHADDVERILGIESAFRNVFSKGVHLVVPAIAETGQVLAFFASDGRLFFMIPMGTRTCIGTTDTRVDRPETTPTEEDIEFLLSNANALLERDTPLSRNDIVAVRCGVRPLAVKGDVNVGDAEWTALSRRHEVDVHHERKVVGIYGGKLTDCLNVGEEVARIVGLFGIGTDRPQQPWYGEPGAARKDEFLAECARCAAGLPSERLWRRYGERAFDLLAAIQRDPAMADPLIAGTDCIRAELFHAARHEMVVHLEDFLRRRTMIALVVDRETLRNDPGLREAAAILFGERAEEEWIRCFGA